MPAHVSRAWLHFNCDKRYADAARRVPEVVAAYGSVVSDRSQRCSIDSESPDASSYDIGVAHTRIRWIATRFAQRAALT